jgi:hypothetical protein
MDTIEDYEGSELKQNEKRPGLLTVLCILTFVNVGMSLFSLLASLFSGPLGEEEMTEQRVQFVKIADEMKSMNLFSFAEIFDKLQRMSESLNEHFYFNSVVSVLVLLVGLVGTLMMWQGKKLGFHLYIGYSLLAIIQIYFFVSPSDVPSFVVIWGLLMSVLFVFMYSRNLKWMTK